MIGLKIAGTTAILSSGGVIAQMLEVPEDFGSWSVTAILGFITLCAIGAMTYMVKKIFESQAEHDKVMMTVAKELSNSASAMNELNARLNKRPCLIPQDK